MKKFFFHKKNWLILFIGAAFSFAATAQTQDDFMNKFTEVYTNAADKKKALVLARELYNMTGKKKELQTVSNYLLLKNIFEVQAPDTALARQCGERSQQLMNENVGLVPDKQDFGSDSMTRWYGTIYPGLFSTKDPENANKAIQYIQQYPSFKNFSTYTFIGYAFERNGDFQKAKENYEKALLLVGNEKEEYHSWMYYTNFQARTGNYLKAEEFIRRMEQLSEEANPVFRDSYKAEAMSTKVVYYLSVGDYEAYAQASEKNLAYFSELWHKNNTTPCDPYPGIRFTNSAYAREMIKDYSGAERLWKSRDSVNYLWVACHNKTYPNNQYHPISMYPVYMMKRGKQSKLPKPVSFYLQETEAHYKSYSEYADISINYMKATHLGFLGSPRYPEIFEPILEQIKKTRNFRESTTPFANYAWFCVRDKQYAKAKDIYTELFELNTGWINDIIFSFGERAFVTYYNAKLKESYENFHSFIKIGGEKQPALFPQLAAQAYNNLLFTKSISLKGTQRRKEAFQNANDPEINKLYDQWIEKKQQLIRQYLKTDDPGGVDTVNKINAAQLNKLQSEVNQLENELTNKAKDFKKYLKIIPPDWKAVQAHLKEGEAAIEMIRFEWRNQLYYTDTAYYAAYIITKNSANPDVVYLTGAARDLDDKYYRLYKNNIKFKTPDNESYNHFWKPISEKLSLMFGAKRITKVYFSPDGIYHLINISTLKNPKSSEYLLDEMDIQYTTSGAELISSPEKEIKTATLMGHPSYRMETAPATALAKGETRSYIRSFRDENIPDLPGTEVEVLAIKKEMEQQKMNVNTYLKADATEDKLYKLHSPGILHIATHGYWSPAGESATDGYRVFNAMANSGLLLSGVINYYNTTPFPDTYDGILTAYEAQNLDLENTSLVILSACETSLGAMDAGEGIYGLQRAFRTAGARSVMTSLWKVDDNATKDFMIVFYQQYLTTGNKAIAFAAAQKAIKAKYIHPYFWGAFVMMGE